MLRSKRCDELRVSYLKLGTNLNSRNAKSWGNNILGVFMALQPGTLNVP